MNEGQRVAWWERLANEHREIQQFGDGHNASTAGGKRGCTQTVLRFLALGWKGKLYTQDDVSRLAGYPTAAQRAAGGGMVPSQVRAFIAAARLPYRIVSFDAPMPPLAILRRANQYGPLMIGVAYSHQPQQRGFVYLGRTADGKPNGYAVRHGKTQLTGFTGGHADVVLGYHVVKNAAGVVTDRLVDVKDPNHGSPARPERPPFDVIHQAQFRSLYLSYSSALGRKLYAVIPTEVFSR